MTIAYNDSHIDLLVWDAIWDSQCADDFRSYLKHRLEQASHADEALERIEKLDSPNSQAVALYPDALAAILDLANAGDSTAQFQAGKMLANGLGGAPDEAAAEHWYRLAILQGELRAHVNLALALTARADSPAALEEATALLRSAADAGETTAMQILARVHLTGRGVAKDLSLAQELLVRAWEHGDPSAAFLLGQMHRQGILQEDEALGWEWIGRAAEAEDHEAVTMLGYRAEHAGDIKTAISHFKQAALKGNDDAAKALGTIYLEGQGVPLDGTEAVKWLRPAALRGHFGAQYNLGIAYLYGIGVIPNRSTALKWISLAADSGDRRAKYRVAEMIEDDDPVGAARLLAEAAREGHSAAQAKLGLAYFRGHGVAEDHATAYKWFRLAALQNNPTGLDLLGWATQAGVGVEARPEEALRWFRKGADLGDARCQYRLGLAYLLARGVARDIAEAAFWLTKAADQGQADAERTIGLMFLLGDGVEMDLVEASKWFLTAAENGDSRAMFELGKLYSEGQGLERNLEEGSRLIKEAATLGDQKAIDWLSDRLDNVSVET